MKIGYSKESITPDFKTEMSGYGYFPKRVFESVLENIYARAIAFYDEKTGKKAVCISCDVLNLLTRTVTEVENIISALYGIEKDAVIIYGMHTHTAPMCSDILGCGEFDERYLELLPKHIIKAVAGAIENIDEVICVSAFKKPLDTIFSYNRADKNGPFDKDIRGLLFKRKTEKPICIINHWTHPVSMGRSSILSPDYPGFACLALEKEGYLPMYQSGCFGNIDPSGTRGPERAKEIGSIIAGEFLSAEKKDISFESFSYCALKTKLELQRLSCAEVEATAEAFAAPYEPTSPIHRTANIWSYCTKRRIAMGEAYETPITAKALKIGDATLVFFNGETCCEFGNYLESNIDSEYVFPQGNSFATARYIAPDYLINGKSYEGFSSCIVYNTLPSIKGSADRVFSLIAASANSI